MKKIRVIHNVPGKKGKQEYREFNSLQEAVAYVERNAGARLASQAVKDAWKTKK